MVEKSSIYKIINPKTIVMGLNPEIEPTAKELDIFLSHLKETKHLVVGGTSEGFKKWAAEEPRDYAHIVSQNSNITCYFPAETSDLPGIMLSYQIDPDLIGTYLSFPALIEIICEPCDSFDKIDPKTAVNILEDTLREISKEIPEFKYISPENTVTRIDMACNYIAKRFKDKTGTRILTDFSKEIQDYIVMLTNYEIYMPQIRQINPIEKKIIVVNEEQVDNLVSFIKDELEAPKPWPEFKKTLTFGSKTIVEIIEQGEIKSVIEGGQK